MLNKMVEEAQQIKRLQSSLSSFTLKVKEIKGSNNQLARDNSALAL